MMAATGDERVIMQTSLDTNAISFLRRDLRACFVTVSRKLDWPRARARESRPTAAATRFIFAQVRAARRGAILFAMHSPCFANATQRQTDRRDRLRVSVPRNFAAVAPLVRTQCHNFVIGLY